MQNWWLWAKPGDLIVIDEAQFVMPRGTLGRKPPYWLQAMEIHRHYGVDFLIITQHPQLIDTTVRALVGMHRHVRSVMGSPVCMVYAWDHASNPERFTGASKSQFIRRQAHYKLFHSAAAHVKPPTAGRSVVVVVPLLLSVLGYKAWAFYDGKKPENQAQQLAASKPGTLPRQPQAPQPSGPAAPAIAPTAVHGCWSQGNVCRCIDQAGRPVIVDELSCRTSAAGYDGLVKWAPHVDSLMPSSTADSSHSRAAVPRSMIAFGGVVQWFRTHQLTAIAIQFSQR